MITDHIPGPIMEIMTMRRIKPGRHITASTNLCTIKSRVPPMYPLTIPMKTAMNVVIVDEVRPTISETRAPKMIRLSMSLPI